ncbi:MAG: hypothetical protein ACLRP3_11620 [Escherichia sp.]
MLNGSHSFLEYLAILPDITI